MSKRLIHLLALTGILMLVLGDAAFLCAQETKSEEFTLEEITVTAQKRAENQQKVPIAMEVISGSQMAENGQNNVSEILKGISNAVINMKDEGMRVTLRGINEDGGQMNNMRVQTPTVAINFDGAYNTEDSAGQNLYDVERVEVLYGPQSTMYGSNSPGGIVNVITASPKLNKYSASGSLEYAKYDLLNLNVALNAPIVSDKLGMRLAFNDSKHGSWVKSASNETNSKNVRLKTLYQPNDDLSIALTGTYGKASSGGMMGGSVGAFVDQDNIPGGGTAWDYVAPSGGGMMPPPGGGLPSGNPNSADRITKGLSSEIAWSTPFASISIIPSYSKSEASDTSYLEDQQIGTEYVDTWRHSENFTKQKNADIRLTSPADSSIKWILGGTYYNSDRQNNDTFDEYPSSNANTYQWEKTKGIYGNITYPFTETLRGTAGYRYSWDNMYNFDGHPKTGTTGITGMDYAAPDYKIGMEYDLADNTMLFASYATSYRVQAMAEQHTIVASAQSSWRAIPPEKLKALTVGSKSRFMGNKLQVNTSAFYYDYRNKQFPIAGDWSRINSTPDNPLSMKESDYCANDAGVITPGATAHCPDFNFNGIAGDSLGQGDPATNPSSPEDPQGKQVGRFESYGLDVSTNFKISAEDRLDVSLSYMHTKWKEATVHFLWWWIWKDSTGKLYEGRNFDNMQNTFSPTWSGTISYEHNFMVGNLGTLTPHVDIQFKSPYKLTLAADADVAADTFSFGADAPKYVGWNKQEAYYTMDANVNFAHASGIWVLNAYVKNVTNYAVKTAVTGGGPVGTSLGLNDPRTYGAVLSVKF